MKWYAGPEGDQRIWYEFEEIELIAEDELRRAKLIPPASRPVTDLERFIEEHLKVKLDQYCDLPDGVLGISQFQARRSPTISISRGLTELAECDTPPAGALGRWRATMAHEAAHVLLHRYLFEPGLAPHAPSGLDAPKKESTGLMRCLTGDVVPVNDNNWAQVRRKSDWREVQANRGMAALLMPSRTFNRVAALQLSALSMSSVTRGSTNATTLATAMAELFKVSKQAATIRLESLSIIATPLP